MDIGHVTSKETDIQEQEQSRKRRAGEQEKRRKRTVAGEQEIRSRRNRGDTVLPKERGDTLWHCDTVTNMTQ